MKAIIGLGNPGKQYENTRHNVGFVIVDQLNLAAQGRQDDFKLNKRLFSEIAIINHLERNSGERQIDNKLPVNTDQILLAKPVTYMNDSGKAVLALKNFYKLAVKDLLIVHDDVSLPLGKIRLQKQGGAGGQHGVESIIEQLGGDKNINRLKIGIGPDPGGHIRMEYVLQRFTRQEKVILDNVLMIAIQATFSWVTSGIDQSMNSFNSFDWKNNS